MSKFRDQKTEDAPADEGTALCTYPCCKARWTVSYEGRRLCSQHAREQQPLGTPMPAHIRARLAHLRRAA